MQFVREGKTLSALIINPRRINPRKSDLSHLLVIPDPDLDKLLAITAQFFTGKKYVSQRTSLNQGLSKFGVFLHSDLSGYTGELPKTYYGWQFLIYQFGLWYISQPHSKASLESQCKSWQVAVVPWLTFLQEAGFIPLGIIWPDMRLPKEINASSERMAVIGERPKEFVEENHVIEKPVFDRSLAGPIFWDTDSEYLDGIEYKLRFRDETLNVALQDYWLKLLCDYRAGRNLLRKVTAEDWLREEASGWKVALARQDRFLVGASRSDGHIWALRFIHHQLMTSNDQNCLKAAKLMAHIAVPKAFLKSGEGTPASPLYELSSLTRDQRALFTYRQMFNRFSGILNGLDFSVAMAILIREHPNWTPASLAGAKLLNSNGRYHILFTDDEASQIFSVDKPRAGKRKYAVISKRARQVLRHLLRASQPIRDLLRRSGSPYWRYLFLGDIKNGQLGHPPIIRPELLNGASPVGNTFPALYPSLSDAGLNSATLNFARIRVTQGVLKWFDTGSIKAVSKCLGNTERSVLTHYIPESLLAAWNERIIRRFQNVLLSLASHNEEWAIDVLDMPSISEMNRFLAQIVHDFPSGNSPIADKIQEYFGPRYRMDKMSFQEVHISVEKNQLHVRLSPESLALLLSYRKWAQINLTPNCQVQPDAETGLTPKHFIDLAGMMQAVAEGSELGDHLREYLDVAKLKRCYEKAVPLIPKIFARFKAFSIQSDNQGVQY